MARTRGRMLVAVSAGAMLLASGCGFLPGGSGGPGQEEDRDDQLVGSIDDDQSEDDQDKAAVEAEPAGGDLDALPVTAQQVGATVHMTGIEYTIEAMDVVDLDAEADRDIRMEGAEVTFSARAANPATESRAANTSVAPQWRTPPAATRSKRP